jgi:hypothetical protein
MVRKPRIVDNEAIIPCPVVRPAQLLRMKKHPGASEE